MDSKELLELIDEIRKRVRVTYDEAREALERNGFDAVAALTELEEVTGFNLRERVQEAGEKLSVPTVEFRRRDRSLFKVPGPLAIGAILLSLKKPKLLLLAAAGILVSGTDIAVDCRGRKFSLQEAMSSKSKQAAGNVHTMKERLDDRFHDMKEQGFRMEPTPHGERYFTIKL